MDLTFFKCVVLTVVFVTAVPTCSHGSDIKRTDDVSVSSLQALVQQQAALIQTLQTRLTTNENKLKAVESSVHTISGIQARQSKAVAFTVRFAHDSGAGLPLTAHATLVFDKVVSNIGNGYDSRTGIFTAPVAGVYAFFLTQMCPTGHPYLHLLLVKEGSTLDLVYTEGGSDPNDQGSTQVTTHLAAGQQVWVKQSAGDAVRGAWYTIFTGYLLHAD